MDGFDLFAFYRTTLFLFLGTYTLLLTISSVWQVVRLLAGPERHKEFLRTYVSYQLLTMRIRPVRGELLQIAALVALLGVVGYLHTLV